MGAEGMVGIAARKLFGDAPPPPEAKAGDRRSRSRRTSTSSRSPAGASSTRSSTRAIPAAPSPGASSSARMSTWSEPTSAGRISPSETREASTSRPRRAAFTSAPVCEGGGGRRSSRRLCSAEHGLRGTRPSRRCPRAEDDAPRLAYADYLHRRGDVKGELIAVQLAARAPRDAGGRQPLERLERSRGGAARRAQGRVVRGGRARSPDAVCSAAGFIERATLTRARPSRAPRTSSRPEPCARSRCGSWRATTTLSSPSGRGFSRLRALDPSRSTAFNDDAGEGAPASAHLSQARDARREPLWRAGRGRRARAGQIAGPGRAHLARPEVEPPLPRRRSGDLAEAFRLPIPVRLDLSRVPDRGAGALALAQSPRLSRLSRSRARRQRDRIRGRLGPRGIPYLRGKSIVWEDGPGPPSWR